MRGAYKTSDAHASAPWRARIVWVLWAVVLVLAVGSALLLRKEIDRAIQPVESSADLPHDLLEISRQFDALSHPGAAKPNVPDWLELSSGARLLAMPSGVTVRVPRRLDIAGTAPLEFDGTEGFSKPILVFEQRDGPVFFAALSDDGVAAAHGDQLIALDAEDEQFLSLTLPERATALAAVPSTFESGDRIVVGDIKGALRLIDPHGGEAALTRSIFDHGTWIRQIHVEPRLEPPQIVAISADGSVGRYGVEPDRLALIDMIQDNRFALHGPPPESRLRIHDTIPDGSDLEKLLERVVSLHDAARESPYIENGALKDPIPHDAADLFRAPGDLVPGSGTGRKGRTVYAPGIRFPLETTPAFVNSQAWGAGGFRGPSGGQCATVNYSFPWRDVFCESASQANVLCAGGEGKQGVTIRPATCERRKHWAVAASDGVISSIGSYSVTLQADNGLEFRYLYLDMARLAVRPGDRVARGERIGLVSDEFEDTPTTIHLHFEIRYVFREGTRTTRLFVPPYTSLVDAYLRLLDEEQDGGEVVRPRTATTLDANLDAIATAAGSTASGGLKQIADVADWPGIAAIGAISGPNSVLSFFCGASVIADRWAVTAANCLVNYHEVTKGLRGSAQPEDRLFLAIEPSNLTDIDRSSLIGIESFTIHPDFINAFSKVKSKLSIRDAKLAQVVASVAATKHGKNIALIKLSRNWNGRKMYLSSSREQDPSDREAIRLAGFGATQVNSRGEGASEFFADAQVVAGSEVLREASVFTISTGGCNAIYDDLFGDLHIADDTICFGVFSGPARGSCQGDSGAPVVRLNERGCPVQVGTVSWAQGCGLPGRPTVGERISAYHDWIVAQVGSDALLEGPSCSLSMPR